MTSDVVYEHFKCVSLHVLLVCICCIWSHSSEIQHSTA